MMKCSGCGRDIGHHPPERRVKNGPLEPKLIRCPHTGSVAEAVKR